MPREKLRDVGTFRIVYRVSETLQETNSLLFEEKTKLANRITTFRNSEVLPRYQLSLSW